MPTDKIKGLHPDLLKVIAEAHRLAPGAFFVNCGLRTLAEQKVLFDRKATRTMKSRHLTGHAFDVVALIDGKVKWDWPLYANLSKVIKQAAKNVGVPIEWGGDWKTFKDGPHYQLPWKQYP